ncbi:MAG: hypothetical protein AB7T06_10975 [Kofleriaceae bacterium]
MRSSLIVAVTTFAAFAGCTCGSSKPEGSAVTGAPGKGEKAVAPSTPPLASKDFYRLDLAAQPSCKTGTPCDVKIALTALGGHHINVEYPTKFVPVPTGELVVDSTKFTIETETRGVMSVRLTPASAGSHTLNGQFKLGVCTDDKCEIDGPKIELPITAI